MEFKINQFKYLLFLIVDWVCDYKDIPISEFNYHKGNDLNKTKINNLLFFVVSANKNLVGIFDNIYVHPFGVRETDINDRMEDLETIEFHEELLHIKDLEKFFVQEYYPEIETGIKSLRSLNDEMIDYSWYELCDLISNHFSYTIISKLKEEGKSDGRIFPLLIKEEETYFKLY